MRSYPYIQELFTNILAKSAGIQGRFYICPRMGIEINADDIEQVVKDLVIPNNGKKYPLSLLMPPRSTGEYMQPSDEWEEYYFTMFFLKTTYSSGTNQLQTPNINTRTSQHTVPQDWHDMKRCAVNFIRALRIVSIANGLASTQFRLYSQDFTITPTSFIGIDRVSGVRMDFKASLFSGCQLEDYNPDDLAAVVIPDADSHPQHTNL